MKQQVLKVVKIGGKILQDEQKLKSFLEDFIALPGPKILVHGGGVYATNLAAELGIPTKMHQGRRITDAQTMQVISMAYSGLNKQLVGQLQGLGCAAVGLCGADAGVMIAKRRPVGEIDYGFVGDITSVNAGFLSLLLDAGIIPVFSAISCTEKGQLLNTNADSVVTELALALSDKFTTELYFCFAKQGVLRDITDDSSVIPQIDSELYKQLKSQGIISEGMLPKLDNCFRAVQRGISSIFLGSESLLKAGSKHTKISI